MQIAHVAAEMAPLIKVGGLGDVVGALPLAQASAGHDVTVVLPAYGQVLRQQQLFAPPTRSVAFRVDGQEFAGGVHVLPLGGAQVILLEQQELFSEGGVYGADPRGSGRRFGWFCGAALGALREVTPTPEVIVAHDWPAALVPLLLRAQRDPADPLADTASVLAIHNLAHQGVFPAELAGQLGVADFFLDAGALESAGQINWLRGAIRCATSVVTVSPTYAREIVWPERGEALDRELLARGADLSGILNGIDTSLWDPALDHELARQFDSQNPAGKAECKAALQRECRLRVDPTLPLFAAISRFDRQKGLDLIGANAAWLIEQQAQIVVLGSGDRSTVEQLVGLARHWRQSVAVIETFDEALSRRIYAGADFFLMPSRFEPCGLGQMVALRYGTIPIVRRTGGLSDTVRDVSEDPATGTGFVFEHADPNGLRWACQRALELWRGPQAAVATVRHRAMLEDFSWGHSAVQWERLLERSIRTERQRLLQF